MPDPVRVFELVPVPLDELHDWLEARGLVVCEHSVKWGDKLDVAVVEVRDGRDTDEARTILPGLRGADDAETTTEGANLDGLLGMCPLS